MHRPLEGIILRPLEPEDLDQLYIYKNDPGIGQMLGGFSTGYSREDMREWLDSHRRRSDEVLWAIVDEEKNLCLGHVGLYSMDSRVAMAEFGIILGDRTAWSRGIGRSCTRFVVSYGFSELNLNRIFLTVLATNERAVQLYRSLGFVEEGRLRQAQYKGGHYIDVLVMGLLREDVLADE